MSTIVTLAGSPSLHSSSDALPACIGRRIATAGHTVVPVVIRDLLGIDDSTRYGGPSGSTQLTEASASYLASGSLPRFDVAADPETIAGGVSR